MVQLTFVRISDSWASNHPRLPEATQLSEIQTSLVFRRSLYSKCLKSRLVLNENHPDFWHLKYKKLNRLYIKQSRLAARFHVSWPKSGHQDWVVVWALNDIIATIKNRTPGLQTSSENNLETGLKPVLLDIKSPRSKKQFFLSCCRQLSDR